MLLFHSLASLSPMGWTKVGQRTFHNGAYWQEWEYGFWRWDLEEFYPGHGAYYYYWETYRKWQKDDQLDDCFVVGGGLFLMPL